MLTSTPRTMAASTVTTTVIMIKGATTTANTTVSTMIASTAMDNIGVITATTMAVESL